MDNITVVKFEDWQEEVIDSSLIQWDYGQILQIEGLELPDGNIEVHFSLENFGGKAPRYIADVKDNVITVEIPPFVFTKEDVYTPSYEAYAWVYVSDEESGRTERKITFTIESRSKPDDWIPPENKDTLGQVLGKINDKVSKSGHEPNKYLGSDENGNVVEKDGSGKVSDEQISKAVEDYIEKNPISVDMEEINEAIAEYHDNNPEIFYANAYYDHNYLKVYGISFEEIKSAFNSGKTIMARFHQQNLLDGSWYYVEGTLSRHDTNEYFEFLNSVTERDTNKLHSVNVYRINKDAEEHTFNGITGVIWESLALRVDTKEEILSEVEETYLPKTTFVNFQKGLANRFTIHDTDTEAHQDIRALISAIPKFAISVVAELPTEDISETTVYLVPSGDETSNVYTEYIYVNETWEKLGTQTLDLSNYPNREEVQQEIQEYHDNNPEIFYAIYGETTESELKEAYSSGKRLVCRYSYSEGGNTGQEYALVYASGWGDFTFIGLSQSGEILKLYFDGSFNTGWSVQQIVIPTYFNDIDYQSFANVGQVLAIRGVNVNGSENYTDGTNGKPLSYHFIDMPSKTSELENDSNFATQEYVEQEIANFDFIKIVTELPETGLPNRTYLVAKTETDDNDLYDEYLWINDAWEYVGTKKIEVDLTGYIKKPSTSGLIYYDVTSDEVQHVTRYQYEPGYNQIPIAKIGGRITTNTPTEDLDCVNKKYADDNFLTNHDGYTLVATHTVEADTNVVDITGLNLYEAIIVVNNPSTQSMSCGFIVTGEKGVTPTRFANISGGSNTVAFTELKRIAGYLKFNHKYTIDADDGASTQKLDYLELHDVGRITQLQYHASNLNIKAGATFQIFARG